MDKPKVTLPNIKKFIQGNLRFLGDKLSMLPEHIVEQVEYRASVCYESCYKGNEGRCLECGCNVPGKWYVDESCNDGKKFPDLLSKDEWEEYKIKLTKQNIDATND